MATSNLADAANNLPTAFSVDSVLQPICMTVELSLKAALVRNGADPNSFKGPAGHDLGKLADRLAAETPHRDDASIREVINHMPHHDFTNKAGVVHSEVMLPEGAPERLRDRETLWNEVEATEKRKDAQLAREVEFAIPREMTKEQGLNLMLDEHRHP